MTSMLRARSVLPLVTALASATLALATLTAPASGQLTQQECDDFVEEWTEAYLTNVYDDLGRLQQAVPALIANLRQEQPFTREQLDGMTVEQIKANAKLVQLQRECMPRLIDLLRQIQRRIGELEQLGSTSMQPNRRGTPRDRLIDDALRQQEELRDAVNAALRRAGISGT